ncbi:anaerobic ribonucleoside-triphosphate reductase activating protein [bacterium]|nr:anaerobic ribonucleoside-triphosphate reductase activating protein [bacterium]
MEIAGFTPFSTIDYEGFLSTVIYTQGCNWNCIFCHNYHLIPKKEGNFSLESTIGFIEKRRLLIDGIVISGGEPTLHEDLPEFCRKIKRLKLLIKLDTNGTNPDLLEFLIRKKLVNYVAMDIKAPFDKYEKIIRTKFPMEKIKKSIKIIKSSNIPHEFRTTIHSSLLNLEDLKDILQIVGKKHKYYLQLANPTERFNVPNQFTKNFLQEFIKEHNEFFIKIRA